MEYILKSAGGRSHRGVYSALRRRYGPEVTAIGGEKGRSLSAFLLSRTPNLFVGSTLKGIIENFS